MIDTLIEWAAHTLNFWWGCSKVSEACRNCYAMFLAKLWRSKDVTWGPGGKRWVREKALAEAVKLNAISKASGSRQRVFVNSMSDTFENHPAVAAMRVQALDLMESLKDTNWLLLTKRPENVMAMVPSHWGSEWPEHIWIGTTVEDQGTADKRIPELLNIPAKVRFLSCEPLLGPVNLAQCAEHFLHPGDGNPGYLNAFNGVTHHPKTCIEPPRTAGTTDGVQWVICGGESGPGSRPMIATWAQSLRDQCAAAEVHFFFKQWGNWIPDPNGTAVEIAGTVFPPMRPSHKKASGRLLDGVEHNAIPVT